MILHIKQDDRKFERLFRSKCDKLKLIDRNIEMSSKYVIPIKILFDQFENRKSKFEWIAPAKITHVRGEK